MKELQNAIGYNFKNENLLINAMTHSSYANEEYTNKDEVIVNCNERLEFLGDSILNMVAAEYLYFSNDAEDEGDLTKLRARVVCEGALYKIAKKINLGKYLYLGKGEELSGGRERVSILADATEALIAALYIDGGIEKAREFILEYIPQMVADAKQGSLNRDYKTALQEIIQKSKEETIAYVQDRQEGPDHNKVFHVTLYINTNPFTEGLGKSKKEAEQNAAKEALKLMGLNE